MRKNGSLPGACEPARIHLVLMDCSLILRAAILGLQGFFPLKGTAANGVGSVEYPVSERKRLALV